METNEKRVEELVALLKVKLDGHEAILGKQKYLAGDVRDRSKYAQFVRIDGSDTSDVVCRRLPSRIYSICHMVTSSLSGLSMDF
jgi:hypothetical protein